MGTQVKLHVRTDEMSDELLMSQGVIGGPMTQLTTPDRFDEYTEKLGEADSVIVGYDASEQYASDVRSAIDSPEEVGDAAIAKVEALVPDDHDVVEFLEEHRGDEVIVVSW